VKQEYIDWLLTHDPRTPYPFIAEECILHLKPKYQEGIRAVQARVAVRIKATRDKEEGILEQYRVKGYAEVEVEVEDDVEEGAVDMGN
jgi:hypothetical protein